VQLKVDQFNVRLFADGADLDGMLEMARKPYIAGLTTNPTLMKKSGITNYEKFAAEVLERITDKPISFEIFSDDLTEMLVQARKINSWAENVYVKVPVTNTKRESTSGVIKILSSEGIKLNVTALMTADQVREVLKALDPKVQSFISVFAGRIADTGRDPLPVMKESLSIMAEYSNTELIWASPRELLNLIQANEIGCHVITATSDILKKIDLIGKDLDDYSLETVQMFYHDALTAGYKI
jgi:transaldolase